MSTIRQKNLANNIVNNLKRKNPLNKAELVVSSGYSETTADRHTSAVFEQKGLQDELKVLGFDENTAKGVVSEIMLDNKVDANARLKATDQVFKVEGSYAPDRSTSVNLNIGSRNMANPELESIRVRFLEELKTKLLQ